jgi:signal transduction histidine kinase
VIFHNRQLPELWRLPDAAFAGTLDQAVGAMRGLLIAHQDPLGEDEEAIPVSSGELPSNLSLRDGRTLECYSAPVRSGEGRSYGSVWYFRDVTERRRVSRQILEAGERERRRIGQDLHDDLCQHLTGITCLGRVLQQRLDANLPKEADAAGQIVDLVEQAVKRARDIARGLQPLHLEAEGLAASLQELSANISAMFQVQCHFACAGPIAIDDPACPIQLYRIAQEAISNAIRHGKAKNIFIDLVQLGDRVILTVEDDGVGIGPAPARPGLGLRTMRHRARMIGATLLVEPADGEGTVVTCKVAAKSAAVQPENAHEPEIA